MSNGYRETLKGLTKMASHSPNGLIHKERVSNFFIRKGYPRYFIINFKGCENEKGYWVFTNGLSDTPEFAYLIDYNEYESEYVNVTKIYRAIIKDTTGWNKICHSEENISIKVLIWSLERGWIE